MNDSERSLTRAEWRQKRRISKSSHHKLKNLGLAPEEDIVPGTAIARISPDADRRWEERMRALAQTEAARLEAERRHEIAVVAGRAAAKSPDHVSRRRRGARSASTSRRRERR
jgi:hypothetical protein